MYGGPAPGTISPDGHYYWTGTQWAPVMGGAQSAQSAQYGYGVAPQVRYGGFWRRSAAYLIDAVVLVLFWLAVAFFLTMAGISIRPGSGPDLISRLLSLVYFAALESSSYQGSLGKMALGLKVIDVQGNRLSFMHALVRNIGKSISIVLCFIGILMIPFSPQKQGLHDRVSGTYVIHA